MITVLITALIKGNKLRALTSTKDNSRLFYANLQLQPLLHVCISFQYFYTGYVYCHLLDFMMYGIVDFLQDQMLCLAMSANGKLKRLYKMIASHCNDSRPHVTHTPSLFQMLASSSPSSSSQLSQLGASLYGSQSIHQFPLHNNIY